MRTTLSTSVGLACPVQLRSSLHLSSRQVITLVFIILVLAMQRTAAQTFPANFAGVQLATGLDPVGMDIAPDGRVFLTEKSGKVRIVKNGSLITTPFVTIPNVDNYNERGLQGIILDPNFSSNNYVYVYYAYKDPSTSVTNNRVSRFTANGDVAVGGSEFVLLNIERMFSAGIHNGGSMAFKDGKLLITVGENGDGNNAQSFGNLKGKVLRLNTDGSIPTDNPYYGSTSGNIRAIWALGFRNPFRIAVQSGTGRVFINDVGQSFREEINEGVAGKNYGWPTVEGSLQPGQNPPANFMNPIYEYAHNPGCAITGGEFYNPSTAQFPAQYVGKYFFADYCAGWIKTINPDTKAVETFATGLNRPIAIKIAPDGSLYFIARGGIGGGSEQDNTSSNNGVLWKLTYTGNGLPVIAVQPTSKTASVGTSVTFSVSASGTPTPTYQWQRNGVNISGATSANYVIPSVALSDNGAVFKVIVSNSAGNIISNDATLTVLNNQNPTATITTPTTGKTYSAGDVISFAGTGSDPEDGPLPPSALTWKVDFYHYDDPAHFHPVLAATSGVSSGSFTIPVSGETSPNVLYRIYLTVTDSKGASTTTSVDVNPIRSVITLVTQPAGLQVKFDGPTVTTPYTFTGVSGILRNLEAVNQVKNGSSYTFYSWSDGGAASHSISTPATSSTITANYIRSADAIPVSTSGVSYTYVEGSYSTLPNFATLTPTKTGTTTDFNLGPRNRDDNFAFLFNGYINVPTDGMYTFYTLSDDGSRLSIGGTTIVDNDGLHGARERAGSIYLKAGKHSIEVAYFEAGVDQVLTVSYEGPGITKRTIPATSLFSVPTTPDLTSVLYARPSILYGITSFSVVVDVTEINSVATSGSFSIKITKDPKLNLIFPASATTVGGRLVQNSAWSFNASDANYYVLSTTQSVAAGGQLSFGLTGNVNPGATTGALTISSTLITTGITDAKPINNNDAEKIEYFQQ